MKGKLRPLVIDCCGDFANYHCHDAHISAAGQHHRLQTQLHLPSYPPLSDLTSPALRHCALFAQRVTARQRSFLSSLHPFPAMARRGPPSALQAVPHPRATVPRSRDKYSPPSVPCCAAISFVHRRPRQLTLSTNLPSLREAVRQPESPTSPPSPPGSARSDGSYAR